jgi:hypothetical protein
MLHNIIHASATVVLEMLPETTSVELGSTVELSQAFIHSLLLTKFAESAACIWGWSAKLSLT